MGEILSVILAIIGIWISVSMTEANRNFQIPDSDSEADFRCSEEEERVRLSEEGKK